MILPPLKIQRKFFIKTLMCVLFRLLSNHADGSRRMSLVDLAPELLLHIFQCLSSVRDVVSLSLTSRRFYNLFTRSPLRTTLLFEAAEREFSPLEDVFQLLTLNNTQAIYTKRDPSLSLSFLMQVIAVGRVAERFVALYPRWRWGDAASEHRRTLDREEAHRLRRAIYRFWLYTQASHHKIHPRTLRFNAFAVEERCRLLRTWTTDELVELEDLRLTLEQLLASELCPADGKVQARWGRDGRVVHLLEGEKSHYSGRTGGNDVRDLFHSARDGPLSQTADVPVPELRARHMTGWGSDIENWYIVQAMLLLSPQEILWLYDHAVTKDDVERYVRDQLGDHCFMESGSTLFHDWVLVIHSRGVDVDNVREGIWNGIRGIVVDK